LPTLGRLGAVLVQTHYDLDPKRFIAPGPGTEAGYARYLGTQLGKPNVVILVADLAGEVVGYLYGGLEGWDYMALRGPAGGLDALVVDPTHRGSGIGKQLLDAALAELEARGAPRAVLSTAEGNAGAQRLFQRAGFRMTMREMTRELGESAR